MKPLNDSQKANARRWVANLRGEGPRTYEQTTQRLSTFDKTAMCCLGVLCDTVDPKGWRDANANANSRAHRLFSTFPRPKVLASVGIEWGFATRLSSANDLGKSFAEIADLITKTLGL
jgi:hypothetical protein